MKMWEKLPSSATSNRVRQVLRYTKQEGQLITKALKSRSGEMAEYWQEEEELKNEDVFPKTLKGVERNAIERAGEMWKRITEEDI